LAVQPVLRQRGPHVELHRQHPPSVAVVPVALDAIHLPQPVAEVEAIALSRHTGIRPLAPQFQIALIVKVQAGDDRAAAAAAPDFSQLALGVVAVMMVAALGAAIAKAAAKTVQET